MVEFRKITQNNDKDFDEAMKIYAEAFPLRERHPVKVIAERVSKGLNQLYIGSLGNEVIFMALLWPLKDSDFILLDYMATKNECRGKGIASVFLKEMHQKLKHMKKYFILEVEDPKCGDDRQEKERRVSFYKYNGVREIKDTRYMLPPLHGEIPTEMILMIFPEYKSGKISSNVVKKIIIQIYQELYGRNTSDALLNSFIDNLRGTMDLV